MGSRPKRSDRWRAKAGMNEHDPASVFVLVDYHDHEERLLIFHPNQKKCVVSGSDAITVEKIALVTRLWFLFRR
jgi:hypothetical protein